MRILRLNKQLRDPLEELPIFLFEMAWSNVEYWLDTFQERLNRRIEVWQKEDLEAAVAAAGEVNIAIKDLREKLEKLSASLPTARKYSTTE